MLGTEVSCTQAGPGRALRTEVPSPLRGCSIQRLLVIIMVTKACYPGSYTSALSWSSGQPLSLRWREVGVRSTPVVCCLSNAQKTLTGDGVVGNKSSEEQVFQQRTGHLRAVWRLTGSSGESRSPEVLRLVLRALSFPLCTLCPSTSTGERDRHFHHDHSEFPAFSSLRDQFYSCSHATVVSSVLKTTGQSWKSDGPQSHHTDLRTQTPEAEKCVCKREALKALCHVSPLNPPPSQRGPGGPGWGLRGRAGQDRHRQERCQAPHRF